LRATTAWAAIAEQTNCSIELIHHSRKTNNNETTVEDARGASALLAAARSVRTINVMTKAEAEKANVDNHRTYFRINTAKQISRHRRIMLGGVESCL
jgi:RecA-family ATPase